MTMIERVAEAIARQLAEDENENLDLARAAIEAMREVDEKVFIAGWAAMNGEPDQGPAEPWLAMIDAVLAESPHI